MTEINRVSLDDLEAVSSRIYNQGFLQINLSHAKQEIEAINWVKSVSIERRWPDRVNIFIEEEDIIGRWNNQSIINSKGNLFNLISKHYQGFNRILWTRCNGRKT